MRTVLLALAVPLLGCATIVSGGHKDVSVATSPRGALVVIKDQKGPEVYRGGAQVVSLKRGHDYLVTVTKPGYETSTTQIGAGFNGWEFGNLIFVLPPVIGVAVCVDLISGGFWSVSESEVSLSLVPSAAPPVARAPAPPAAGPVDVQAE